MGPPSCDASLSSPPHGANVGSREGQISADSRNGTESARSCQCPKPDVAATERDITYLCGNPDMIDATFTQLKELGMPIKHIRREKYVSSR
jgi:ferredoxin-NADP reductase